VLDNILTDIASPERLGSSMVALILVALLGMMFGPCFGNSNPCLWVVLDKICGGLIRRSYNTARSETTLQFRGMLLLGLYVIITCIIAALAVVAEMRFHLAGFTDPLLLSCTLCGGATWHGMVKLHHALAKALGKSKKPERGSFYEVAVSTRSNLNTTDDHGIIRVAIGFLATSYDKGLIAPLFWYLIAGLPGAYIYSGIAAARWSLSKDGFAKGIGTLALRLETLAGFLPQIVSTPLIVLAALFTPDASMLRGVRGLFTFGKRAPYAEGGLPLTVMAWALGVSLGGPIEDKDGSVLKRAWVGPPSSSARLEQEHLRRAVYMNIMAFVLMASIQVCLIMIWKLFSA